MFSGEDRRRPGRDFAEEVSDLSLEWLIQA